LDSSKNNSQETDIPYSLFKYLDALLHFHGKFDKKTEKRLESIFNEFMTAEANGRFHLSEYNGAQNSDNAGNVNIFARYLDFSKKMIGVGGYAPIISESDIINFAEVYDNRGKYLRRIIDSMATRVPSDIISESASYQTNICDREKRNALWKEITSLKGKDFDAAGYTIPELIEIRNKFL
jgi:hypothetical protein